MSLTGRESCNSRFQAKPIQIEPLDGSHVHGRSEGHHHEQRQELWNLRPDGMPVYIAGRPVQLVDFPEGLRAMLRLQLTQFTMPLLQTAPMQYEARQHRAHCMHMGRHLCWM